MGVSLLTLGAIFFPGANIIVRKSLQTLFNGSLSSADQYLITEKCVSSLQAVMSTAVGTIILMTCQENIITNTHWLTKAYAWFGLPYFIYDVWAMYNTHYYLNEDDMVKVTVRGRLRHFVHQNIPMLIHHLLLPCIFFPIILYLRNDKGDYFIGMFYTCETAIPFISLRFILAQLQMKNSALYIISGLLMIFVFFVVRICVFPFLYWKYGTYASVPFLETPFRIPVKCNIGCLIVISLQIYFFGLMVRGAFRVFYKMYKRNVYSALIKNE